MDDELHVETLAEELARFDRMDAGWQESAVCASVDPELFFPEVGGTPQTAKGVCLSCPVRQECLEYAQALDAVLPTPVRGVWGGTSEQDRDAMRRGVDVVLVKTCVGCGRDMPSGYAVYCNELCSGRAEQRRIRAKRKENAA
ncbi:MAG TPA: WhiB family transcriptional regulator [Acidimicrobiales bacterium]|nr:WhiB family transcriptional regulator [Acidimicrobiales bacterium]